MSGAITAGTLATVAGIGAAGSIGGALIGSNSANKAADAQTAAANHAADLQFQESKDALDFQKQQYETSQQQAAPWLNSGTGSLANLNYLLGNGQANSPAMQGMVNPGLGAAGSLLTPYSGTFTAPTELDEQNDPGYMARLKLGTDALQHSAAARGSVLTGGTAKALDQYSQDYASNEYGNVYNRALSAFQNNYNVYNQNQTNQYNRLAALSGLGQQTASQLGQQGQAASNNVTSNLLSTGQNVGQDYNNAGAATASGYVGSGNAWSGALGGIGGNLSNLLLLSKLGGGSGISSGGGGGTLFPGIGGFNG